jgi:hypothetical protein
MMSRTPAMGRLHYMSKHSNDLLPFSDLRDSNETNIGGKHQNCCGV